MGPFDAWEKGDERAQEAEGYEAGRKSKEEGWVPDWCDETDTPYARGFLKGRREAGGD